MFLDKEEEGEEGYGMEDEGEKVSELWDVIRVIPAGEETVECCNKRCTDQAVVTWSSNIDPEDKWDLCKKIELEEMGEWSDGVDPITKKSTEEALDERLVEILEHLKKGETLASIAKATCLKNHTYTLYSSVPLILM